MQAAAGAAGVTDMVMLGIARENMGAAPAAAPITREVRTGSTIHDWTHGPATAVEEPEPASESKPKMPGSSDFSLNDFNCILAI